MSKHDELATSLKLAAQAVVNSQIASENARSEYLALERQGKKCENHEAQIADLKANAESLKKDNDSLKQEVIKLNNKLAGIERLFR